MTITQVEFAISNDISKLEEYINEFLSSKDMSDKTVKDIKYQVSMSMGNGLKVEFYTAMIIYESNEPKV